MVLQRPIRVEQEPLFEKAKFLLHGYRIVNPRDQFVRSSLAPYIGESAVAIMQCADRKSEKRERAALLEMDAQEFILIGSFDKKESRPWTRDPSL